MMTEIPGKGKNIVPYRACVGCAESIVLRYILKAAGKNTIIVGATGCAEVFSTPYPYTSWEVPYIHVAFENAAAVASGIESALKILNKKTNVIAIAGDGATFDIGCQALSGAIERGHNFCYICLDNEAYMNTGVQRSSSTPFYARTTTSPKGKPKHKKPMPFIIAAHKNVYVATANPAYPQDLIKKIKKGLEFKGPSYIQIICPCVPGWDYPANKTIKIAKLAFETNFYPLYEIENNKLKLNKNTNKKPVSEYLKLQGRFKHLTKKEIQEIQTFVDENYKNLLKYQNKLLL